VSPHPRRIHCVEVVDGLDDARTAVIFVVGAQKIVSDLTGSISSWSGSRSDTDGRG
jgi:hypothetical protein